MSLQSKASVERGSADGVAEGLESLSDLGYWEDGGYGAGSGEVDEAVEMAWQG